MGSWLESRSGVILKAWGWLSDIASSSGCLFAVVLHEPMLALLFFVVSRASDSGYTDYELCPVEVERIATIGAWRIHPFVFGGDQSRRAAG